MSKNLEGAATSSEPLRSLEGFKRTHVRCVVEACNGDLDKAAALLGVVPGEITRRLREILREPKRNTR